jgi:hypothetical protein
MHLNLQSQLGSTAAKLTETEHRSEALGRRLSSPVYIGVPGAMEQEDRAPLVLRMNPETQDPEPKSSISDGQCHNDKERYISPPMVSFLRPLFQFLANL